MVNYRTGLDSVYFALSSDIRRNMIELISKKPLSLSEIATSLKLSLPALHKHTKVLEQANLIRKKKVSRTTYLALEPKSLISAEQWIAEHKKFWSDNLTSLESYFKEKE